MLLTHTQFTHTDLLLGNTFQGGKLNPAIPTISYPYDYQHIFKA